jgi:hypothetical protein
VVRDQPDGPALIPLEAIKAVTVGNLSQVLDHRITRSLGRTVHVLHFLEVVSCACDHLGRLTALVSLTLRCTVSEDCTVVFNPHPPPDFEGRAGVRHESDPRRARHVVAVNPAGKGVWPTTIAGSRGIAPAFPRNAPTADLLRRCVQPLT